MKTRIIFFGTPEFSVPFFNTLIKDTDFEIVAVITQIDKPAGRKQILTPPPIKVSAQNKSIPVFQFQTLKSDEAKKTIAAQDADIFVVVAYGKLIPASILSIPKKGCLNVHPSLLPRHRGPSPMQDAILSADEETGVTIMLLDEGMDTGPILAQKKIPLDKEETFVTLKQKVLDVAPQFFMQTLHAWIRDEITPQIQTEANATVTHLLKREDGLIDRHESADKILRKIRALNPWPGVYFIWKENGKDTRLKIIEAKSLLGKLELIIVQPEGKSKMKFKDFLQGHPSFLNE